MSLGRERDVMFSSIDIIDLAIQIEKNGEKVYRDALKEVQDHSLGSMLRWLADEEVEHARWFSQLKEAVQKAPVDRRLEDMGRKMMQGILGNESFSLKEVDFGSLDGIDYLFKLATEFERDTVLFFEMFEPFLEVQESIEHLKKIIEEEEGHIRALEEYMRNRPLKVGRGKLAPG
jgi:rubrerythrin